MLEYEALSTFKKLGLPYKVIDACVNGYMLLWGVHANVDQCPKCGEFMYKQVGRSNVPQKVLRHFPLTFRLEPMYNTQAQVELMIWHANNWSRNGLVHHVMNSKQWELIDLKWPSFGNEPKNVWLGLFTDGLNMFEEIRSTWSLWPMVLVNYNISLWLTIKRHFMVLYLIVPRPTTITSNNLTY
jgi:hypothetical protein